MKARHRKQRAKRASADKAPKRTSNHRSDESESRAYGDQPRRRAKNLGKVQGSVPMQRADRKPRRVGGRSHNENELSSHDLARLAHRQAAFNTSKAKETMQAAVKRRRVGKGFGGGLPPAANDNEDIGMRIDNSVKNWRAGEYPAWRKDIANNNTLLPLPGGKK